MHHISKNWERVFDFQYKVVIGQCVLFEYISTLQHFRYQGDLDFLSPLLTTLQTNCSKIRSLIIDYISNPSGALMEVINHIQEYLPRISSVTMNDCDDINIQIGHLGHMFDFRNLQKLVLNLMECPSGLLDGQGNILHCKSLQPECNCSAVDSCNNCNF